MPVLPFAPGWPEIAAAIGCTVVVLNAARRGFLREGSLLLGLALALWLAGQLYRPVGVLLLRDERAGPGAALLYASLAIVLLLTFAGLSAVAAPLVRREPFLTLDRAAGAGIGALEAALLIGLIVLAIDRLGAVRPAPGGPLARAADLAGGGLAWLAATIPTDVLAQVHPR